ncbi:MAG: response regulator [Rhodospirillales bacterium]
MSCVLLIDDDDLILETLTLALTEGGYQVVAAMDGNEALEKFKQNDIDIVVTDIIMPNKEGIETIIQFRQISPHLPIIAMSGGGRSSKLDFLSVARKLGASETLKKPFSPDELIEAIRRNLKPAD